MSALAYKSEQEEVLNNQMQLFRLAELHRRDEAFFKEVCDYLPFGINVNKREGLDTIYCSKAIVQWLDEPAKNIISGGFDYVKQLLDLRLTRHFFNNVRAFENENDKHAICSYYQRIRFHNELTWYYTHKIIIDDRLYLNLGYTLDSLGKPGEFIEELLGETFVRSDGWQKFQSLTRREKEILMLVADGKCSQQIADQLFVSKLTVQTHRKNIMQKLDAKNLVEVLRFTEALKLMGIE